jgi:exopolyphosphatase/guanosine-5'-triphosphate,3'-diphosphate pyrophosphatase
MKHDSSERHLLSDPELAHFMGGIVVDDLPHARHVAQLAQELFNVTWPMHGFGPKEMELLMRAALLHDAGILVNYRAHHKESLRLIEAATLPGLSKQEQNEVACIARYHRRSLPEKHHAVYRDLSRVARQRVAELGGILRLADAFDYAHDGGVGHLLGLVLSASGEPTRVLIRVCHHIGDHRTLRWVMERAHEKRDLFERAFHCRVSISPELEADLPAFNSQDGLLPLSMIPAGHD